MRKGRDGGKREKKKNGKKTGKKRKIRMKIVATTSLPAVDRPNADPWNAACSCQYINYWLLRGIGAKTSHKMILKTDTIYHQPIIHGTNPGLTDQPLWVVGLLFIWNKENNILVNILRLGQCCGEISKTLTLEKIVLFFCFPHFLDFVAFISLGSIHIHILRKQLIPNSRPPNPKMMM